MAIKKRVKSNLHPPTCSKVRISTSNFKTGQFWPSNSRKNSTFNLPVLRMNSNFWASYIIFSSILTFSNEKTQNYKVVDLIEVYNLHIKLSSSDIVLKGFYFLKFESHHTIKYGAEILDYFFEYLTVLKWKKIKTTKL